LHLTARFAQRASDRADVAVMGLQRGDELFAALDVAERWWVGVGCGVSIGFDVAAPVLPPIS
jgi:hypothetical protein